VSVPKCRLVVADDVVYFRTLLRIALDPERFEIVAEAGDGREAIAAAGETKPDVILLDLSMPIMDGLQAIPAIRELSPDTKILVLSGFDAHSMSTEALELGADAYLEKGVDLGEITRAITDLFDGGDG
jgi:DNA-binding NarL/FixJ family response regulator